MDNFYQPNIVQYANEILHVLRETGFFTDFEIEDESFAKDYFCKKLTDKFIKGELDEFIDNVFNNDEIDKFLNEIVAGSLLQELQNKGLVDSIEDENNEERFFLTEKGKEMAKGIQKNSDTNLF